MPSRLRRAAALAAMLALLPAGAVQAMHLSARDGVVLRYHFTPGATYAYHMAMTLRMSMSGTGIPGAGSSAYTASARAAGLVRYRVLAVDATGATVEMTTGAMPEVTTAAGKTTTTSLPAQARSVHMGFDGSVQGAGADLGLPGLESVGELPVGAVAPGAHWTSTAAANVPNALGPSMAPVRVTTENVFSRYVQAGAQQAAAIDSTGTMDYVSDTPLGGQTWHTRVSGHMQGRQLFGLSTHRTVSSQAQLDMRMFMSGPAVQGQMAAVRMHLVMAVSMTPAGS